MPFADPDVYAKYHRNLVNEKYWTDDEFRENEAKRKAEWYQANKKRCAERLRAWRAANPEKAKELRRLQSERAKSKKPRKLQAFAQAA